MRYIAALVLLTFLEQVPSQQEEAKSVEERPHISEEVGRDSRATVASLLKSLEDLGDRIVRVRTLVGVQFDSSADGKVVYDYTYGTGVFIANDGLIATAHHLVRNRNKVSEGRREVAVLLRGERNYIPVDVIAEDPRADLALVRVNPRALPFRKWFEVSAGPRPREGGRSYVLGIRAGAPPESFEFGVIEGKFVDADRRLQDLYKGDTKGRGPWVGISQKILPGYSGGAILDVSGALTGIVVGAPELRGEWIDLSFGVSVEIMGRLFAPSASNQEAEINGKAREP